MVPVHISRVVSLVSQYSLFNSRREMIGTHPLTNTRCTTFNSQPHAQARQMKPGQAILLPQVNTAKLENKSKVTPEEPNCTRTLLSKELQTTNRY